MLPCGWKKHPLLSVVAALIMAVADLALASAPERFVKDGVAIEFTLERPSSAQGDGPVLEGEHAVARFALTDVSTGAPLRGLSPSAWIDLRNGARADEKQCKGKIAQYLQGSVGVRPLVDLNSYFVLVMNRDSTISVVDPVVSMTGRTNLFTTVLLPRPGGDWVQSPDRRRLFVSMPAAGQVAVIDAERFKLTSSVDAGERPLRVAMQRDGKYLWVANDARASARSGVTVLDAGTLEVAGHVATGRGHHELALSVDDRRAFVTNRESGTVSVIDTASLRKVADVATGPLPISVATSALSQAVYVADGKAGSVTVIDPARHQVIARMSASAGLGPLRFSQDGRWGFAVNPAEHAVFVLDAAENRIVHRIPLDGEPYQVTFTRAFAYVRLLDSPKVYMVSLVSLGEGKKPTVQSFGAGTQPPRDAGDLSIADATSPASTEAAVFALNPADNNTYFYMEGMNAPMGSYGGYGHAGRAVTVVDRTLREVEPGVYAAPVKIPAAGEFDVAMLLDNPRVAHCFAAEARANPALAAQSRRTVVKFLTLPGRAVAGDSVALRFTLSDALTQRPSARMTDVRVLYHGIPGGARREALAREVEDGTYAVTLDLPEPGTWYLFVAAPSAGVTGRDMPFRSIVVEKERRL